MRKSTPKSSRLYSLATDYKFWYVRYLNKSCCFFSNFVNVNRVIAKKLLRKSKRASKPSLNNHKTTKSSSRSCGNPFKNYARVDFTKSFHSSMTSIYAQHSLDLSSRARDRDRYSKIAKRMKQRGQGEPSRLSVKKILRFMKKRKARCKLKIIVRKSTPKFSQLYSLATYNKFWYVRYLNRSCCFFANFVNVNRIIAKKLLRQSKRASNPSLTNHKTTKSSSRTERFCVSRMKLLTSGDIELNPGPQQGVNNQTTLSVGSTMLLSFRLRQLGLRPLDVGGAGDCFFRAVSHQLYGDPSHHWYIRQAGIHYLRKTQSVLLKAIPRIHGMNISQICH